MILQNALEAKKTEKECGGDEAEKECGGYEARKAAEDDLVTLMSDMEIAGAVSNEFCNCTRKCATKKCPCLSNSRVCNELCHKNNNSCTNI